MHRSRFQLHREGNPSKVLRGSCTRGPSHNTQTFFNLYVALSPLTRGVALQMLSESVLRLNALDWVTNQ